MAETNAQQTRIPRRVRNSIVFVRYVTPFAVGWLIIALVIEADRLAIAAGIASGGFGLGIILHHYAWHFVARVLWLLAANVAIFIAALVTPPEGHMSFILLASAAMPFVIFSGASERIWALGLVWMSVGLWFLGWTTDYSLLEGYDVSPSLAETVVAPASAVTVFGVVLFVIGYYARISRQQMDVLRSARREAEKASLAKSSLLQSVSHEMRTPLHAISGYAGLLHEDARSGRAVAQETLANYTDKILIASDDMVLMVENILDFANLEGEEIRSERRELRLEKEVRAVLKRFQGKIDAKGLTITLHVPSDLTVFSEPDLVNGVLKQILDNAIKFSKNDGDIVVAARLLSGHDVEITVRDRGPGFPDGHTVTALTAFEKLGHETGSVRGLGLGLALV